MSELIIDLHRRIVATGMNQWRPLAVQADQVLHQCNVIRPFDAVLGFWITIFTTGWGSSIKGDIRVLLSAHGTEPSGILLINDLAHQLSPVGWGNALGRFGLANTTTPIAAGGGLVSHAAIRRP